MTQEQLMEMLKRELRIMLCLAMEAGLNVQKKQISEELGEFFLDLIDPPVDDTIN